MAAKCFFCGEGISQGSGKVFVKDTGQILHFHDSKCQRNFNLGREGKDTRWTKHHADSKAGLIVTEAVQKAGSKAKVEEPKAETAEKPQPEKAQAEKKEQAKPEKSEKPKQA